MTQEQLQDQIQKLIKNNKKHFSKDQGTEELHKYLKQVLTQYLDGGQGPSAAQGPDKQGVNELINELIRMNGPLVGGPPGGAPGANGRMRSGKDRAHSEKTGSTSAGGAGAGGANPQGYHA